MADHKNVYSSLAVKVAVALTICIGVFLIIFMNERSFTAVVDDDIRNISKLSAATICAKIDDSLEGPIFVGQTMANDLFLRQWLVEEETAGDAADVETMKRYLSGYRQAYDYDSVFLVSAQTSTYYYQEGVNKTVSAANPHDVWYYAFVESGKPYALDVDVDEIGNVLTVFVNCRIEAPDGTLLGVAGVGVKMSRLQALLKEYEDAYDMKAFLMDETGLVQVDAIADVIETTNFFSAPKAASIKDQILGNKTGAELFWRTDGGSGFCLVSQYVEKLDWYLVVEKNTESVRATLNTQMRFTLVLTFAIIGLVLIFVSKIVGKYNRTLLHSASMDGVTGLPNNRMFRHIFDQNAKKAGHGRGKLFIFDIDDFKQINDTFGHMYGNSVLSRVAKVAKNVIGENGVVSRWGGDEFVGVVYGGRTETEDAVRLILQGIEALDEFDCAITVSIGATILAGGASLGQLLREADAAMYNAKKQGKNKAYFYKNDMET